MFFLFNFFEFTLQNQDLEKINSQKVLAHQETDKFLKKGENLVLFDV